MPNLNTLIFYIKSIYVLFDVNKKLLFLQKSLCIATYRFPLNESTYFLLGGK